MTANVKNNRTNRLRGPGLPSGWSRSSDRRSGDAGLLVPTPDRCVTQVIEHLFIHLSFQTHPWVSADPHRTPRIPTSPLSGTDCLQRPRPVPPLVPPRHLSRGTLRSTGGTLDHRTHGPTVWSGVCVSCVSRDSVGTLPSVCELRFAVQPPPDEVDVCLGGKWTRRVPQPPRVGDLRHRRGPVGPPHVTQGRGRLYTRFRHHWVPW